MVSGVWCGGVGSCCVAAALELEATGCHPLPRRGERRAATPHPSRSVSPALPRCARRPRPPPRHVTQLCNPRRRPRQPRAPASRLGVFGQAHEIAGEIACGDARKPPQRRYTEGYPLARCTAALRSRCGVWRCTQYSSTRKGCACINRYSFRPGRGAASRLLCITYYRVSENNSISLLVYWRELHVAFAVILCSS